MIDRDRYMDGIDEMFRHMVITKAVDKGFVDIAKVLLKVEFKNGISIVYLGRLLSFSAKKGLEEVVKEVLGMLDKVKGIDGLNYFLKTMFEHALKEAKKALNETIKKLLEEKIKSLYIGP